MTTFIVYCTTNTINQKFYIGYHETVDYKTFDGYFGSGKALKLAIKKYGKKAFIRTNIAVFSNSSDAFNFETAYLNMINYRNNKKCYNIASGGRGPGGWLRDIKAGIFEEGVNWAQIAGRKGGRKIKEEKLGIFSFTPEERSEKARNRKINLSREEIVENARSAGILGGIKCLEEKIGFHAMTFEEKSARSKKTMQDRDPQLMVDQGKMMGSLVKGSIIYNDGVNYFRYMKHQQEIQSFDDFLNENPQFKRGRPRKVTPLNNHINVTDPK